MLLVVHSLHRYGDEFDYDSEAVSVASGGIVRRDALSWAAGDGRLTGDVRLAINDPLTGGRCMWVWRCC